MPEERKLVTALFADVVGSTALGAASDPEVVRNVMARYFERMRAIAEEHGGTVEKFIGDAVMVVFGVPRLHDDDAERAVRAALAMREAMPALNADLAVDLRARIGVNSGEAVAAAAPPERQFLVTGDAVNVAARLQQAAEPDEVLVGELTERLTRAAIDYEPSEPVRAKGKAEPLVAFRALRARSVLPEPARGLPAMRAQLVGRQRELRLLIDVFERVRDERQAHVFTVLGVAGVGKSRLVGEALARIAARDGARVLRGRCLPYGRGITYWPLIEVLRADGGIAFADGRDAALHKLEARLATLFPAERERASVRSRLGVLLALARPEDVIPDVPAERIAAEIAWGLRRYLEALAARGATVVVMDDLQWAERPLVEVVERVAERVTEAALLLLVIGRPELMEVHPAWGAGKPNATLITLDPLTPEETTTLISRLLDIDELPAELRARIVARSEGNPLFCEEFVRMLIDEGRVRREGDRWRASASAADVRVPESIQALLAARIDGLPPEEKQLVRVASVVGERFDEGDLRALHPRVDAAWLEQLIRKGLVIEDRGAADAERLRFKHLLVRDAAYASLPKAERAELHERFGRHLEGSVADRVAEYAEILAHHAERAFALSLELRLAADVTRPRAERALALALRLGERGRERGEAAVLAAAVASAQAAADAMPDRGGPEVQARVALLEAERLLWAADYRAAAGGAERAIETALRAGRADIAAAAGMTRLRIESFGGESRKTIDEALAEATRLQDLGGDPATKLDLETLRLELLWSTGRLREMIERGLALRDEARRLGYRAREASIVTRIVPAAMLAGRVDEAHRLAAEAEAITDELDLRATARRLKYFTVWEHWLRGDAERAADAYAERERVARAEGEMQMAIGSQRNRAELLIELGRYDEADGLLAHAIAESERLGERWNRTEMLASRARCAVARGDLASAEALIEESTHTVRGEDLFAVAYLKQQVAAVRDAQGRTSEAEAALGEAVAVAKPMEYQHLTLGALVGLAEFLARHGRAREAADVVAEAEAVAARTGFRFADARIRALRERIPA